jgi:hypothetical protein
VEPDQPAEPKPGKLWSLTLSGETLTCELFDHPVKQWEVCLERNGKRVRCEGCWSTERAMKLANRWRQRAISHGWVESTG